MGSIMQPPALRCRGRPRGAAPPKAGASVMRNVATTIGTTPITRKAVQPGDPAPVMAGVVTLQRRTGEPPRSGDLEGGSEH